MANIYGGNNTGKGGLRVRESDGSPDVKGVSDIIVSDGTLTDDGNGTITLTTGGGGGGTPGGVDTQVQYNDAGSFGGNAGLTFNDATSKLTVGGEIEIDGDLNHDGTNVGFYTTTPIPQQAPAPTPNPTAPPLNTYNTTQMQLALDDLKASIDDIITILQNLGLTS